MQHLIRSIGSQVAQLDDMKRKAELEANRPLMSVDEISQSRSMLRDLFSVLDTLSSRRDLIGDRFCIPYDVPHLDLRTEDGTHKDVSLACLVWEQDKLVLALGHEGYGGAFVRDGVVGDLAASKEALLAERNFPHHIEDTVHRGLHIINYEMGHLLEGNGPREGTVRVRAG